MRHEGSEKAVRPRTKRTSSAIRRADNRQGPQFPPGSVLQLHVSRRF